MCHLHLIFLFKVPKKEYYNLNIMMTFEDMMELNVEVDDFVKIDSEV